MDLPTRPSGVEPTAVAGPGTKSQERLTPAEARVLPLLATYLTLEGIAERLGVRRSTVKTHVVGIYMKLGVSCRTEAVERAEAKGLLTAPASAAGRERIRAEG